MHRRYPGNRKALGNQLENPGLVESVKYTKKILLKLNRLTSSYPRGCHTSMNLQHWVFFMRPWQDYRHKKSNTLYYPRCDWKKLCLEKAWTMYTYSVLLEEPRLAILHTCLCRYGLERMERFLIPSPIDSPHDWMPYGTMLS
jgi:hypothetical protein